MLFNDSYKYNTYHLSDAPLASVVPELLSMSKEKINSLYNYHVCNLKTVIVINCKCSNY